MKRCPHCNRLEPDDTLGYCRADGTVLISDSGPVSAEGGTVKFGSAAVSSEIQTSVLPQTITDAGISRPTAQTTVLPFPHLPKNTVELSKPKRRKSIIATAAIVTAALIAGGYLYWQRGKNIAQIESIAVLPFQNSSADPDAEYLSDGLAESLIYRLSQLPDLKVSPTSSVMRYKDKQTDVKAIAGELGVGVVMTGRISQLGDNLTISVELVDVPNNKLVWGEQYDRKMSDLLATQRQIATEIVQKLRLKLSGNNEKGLTKHYTENNDAYQLYLKGRFYWNRRTVEDDLKSLEYFHKAVEADPKFALAYVGISDAR
ncbi:MAG: eukaryotic-like serine/threonine-protein kinase, partial [Blastocatellia bacterium]|nr:eukaryotic-like serine/threonine-protein kinase [Blastocatellia bacterium]